MVDLFKDIPNDVVEKTLDNIGNNLREIGKLNQHIKTRHIGVSQEMLLARLETSDKEMVTTFEKASIAERVIQLLLKKDYSTKIRPWISLSYTDVLSVYGTFNKIIGYGYKRKDNQLYLLHSACLVLEKNIKLPWGIRVVTCYPVINGGRKWNI